MRGLLLKDWYVIWRVGKSWFFFTVLYAVFAAAGGGFSFFGLMNVMLSSMIVKTLMAYEEQNHWDSLIISMPVTKKQLVWEKYLFGLIFIMSSSLITVLFMSAGRILYVRRNEIPLDQILLLCMTSGIFILAVELPFYFKMGVIRSRAWSSLGLMIVLGFMGGLGGLLLAKSGEDAPGWFINTAWPVLIALAVLSGAALLLSVRLSIRFYTNREL